MDLASQMLMFVAVVDQGSISAAARLAGHTPSALSKQMGFLEDSVGQRLLNRTSKGIRPTDAGTAFYRQCKLVSESYHDAKAFMANLDGRIGGNLRVTSGVFFGRAKLIPALPKFLEEYPDIHFSLELSDRPLELEAENIDAAIRFEEQIVNSYVMARKIMRNERVLCASPAYIARHGMPQSYADLDNHNCLHTWRATRMTDWEFTEGPKTHIIGAKGNFEANSADVVLRAAVAGLGIARLSTYALEGLEQSGQLVRVLPDYVQRNSDIAVIYANKRNLAPKIRVFVDFLVKTFAA